MKGCIIFASLLVLAVGAPAVSGQQSPARARTIAPVVTKETIAVGYANLSRLDTAQLGGRLRKFKSPNPAQWQLVRRSLGELKEFLSGYAVKEIYLVRNISGNAEHRFIVAVPAADRAQADKIEALFKDRLSMPETRQLGNLVVTGGKIIHGLGKEKLPENPYVAPAFAAVEGADIQVVVAPGKTVRTFLDAVFFPLPPVEPGDLKKEDVTEVCHWIASGIYLEPELSAKLIIKGKDAQCARKLHNALQKKLTYLKENADAGRPIFAKLQELLNPRVVGDQVLAELDGKEMLSLLWTILLEWPDVHQQLKSADHLKQLGRAFLAYQAAHKRFPTAANYDKNGNPLLSWRVHLLPYLGEESLCKQFKLDEPWDSPHNKKLIAKIPSIYRSPYTAVKPGMTTILAPVGAGTVIGPRPTNLLQITSKDGASYTILVVEAADENAVIWTKPEDLQVDAKDPRFRMGNNRRGYFNALFVDGSVRSISRDTPPEILNAYFRWNDGKKVNLP